MVWTALHWLGPWSPLGPVLAGALAGILFWAPMVVLALLTR